MVIMPRLQRTERGFDRIVNFSDAIVAIAVTFLVLPLIDLLGKTDDPDVLLRESGPAFFSYALTFVIMLVMWLQHHRVFEFLGDYDGFVLWINGMWLMLVAILPVLSALSNEDSVESGLVLACYFFVLAAMSSFIALVSGHARRHPSLLIAGADPATLKPFIAGVIGGFLATVGGLVLVDEAFSWLALVGMPILLKVLHRGDPKPADGSQETAVSENLEA